VGAQPTIIGPYEVIRPLGKGGMGAVYLARDPAIDRLVAIKLLREGLDSAELRERFTREARSAGRLRHPNIVTIFHVGEHDAQPFIVMEYIPGDTLGEIIKRQLPLTIARKLKIIEDLCRGLAYAHKAGIVHRDIKPANILVDSEGVVKILDFGIARIGEQGITRMGMMMGTPNYMSPEQINPGTADHRSDVFAVGLVFYELLAYVRAFPGEDFAVLHNILHTEPQPIEKFCPGIDQEVAAVLQRALAKQPEARYQDLAAMRADLGRIWARIHTPGDEGQDEGPITAATQVITADTPTLAGRYTETIDAQVRELIESARAEFAAGRYQAALDRLQRAEALHPSGGTVGELQRTIQQLWREVTGAQERYAAIERAVERARERLGAGALGEAREALSKALSLGATGSDMMAVRRDIEAAEAEQARAEERAASEAVSRARAFAARGEFGPAIDLLERHQPARPDVNAALADIRQQQAAATRREEEERQARVRREEQERQTRARQEEEARRAAAARHAEEARRAEQRAAEEAKRAEERARRDQAAREAASADHTLVPGQINVAGGFSGAPKTFESDATIVIPRPAPTPPPAPAPAAQPAVKDRKAVPAPQREEAARVSPPKPAPAPVVEARPAGKTAGAASGKTDVAARPIEPSPAVAPGPAAAAGVAIEEKPKGAGWVLPAAAAAVLLLAGGGWFLMRGGTTSESPAGSASAPAAPAATPASSGSPSAGNPASGSSTPAATPPAGPATSAGGSEPAPNAARPPAASTTRPDVNGVHGRFEEALRQNDLARALRVIVESEPAAQNDPIIKRDLDNLVVTARRNAARAFDDAQRANASRNAAEDYRSGMAKRTEGDAFDRGGRQTEAVRSLMAASAFFTRAASARTQIATTSPPPVPAPSTSAPSTSAPPQPVQRPAEPAAAPGAPSTTAGEQPRPAAAEPPPQPARSPATDAADIRATLAQFVAGYEGLDPAAIRRVYPSAPNLNFNNVRSYSMVLQNPQISLQGDTATVTTTRQIKVQMAAGRPQEASQRTVFTMRRGQNGWTIERVQ
jgi:tetratricopeptide (TPR) repeat protein